MRYKITIVERDDVIHSPDAQITEIHEHEGDAIDVLRIAVGHDNEPPRFHTTITRDPDGSHIQLSDLIEAARGSATTTSARTAWVDTMITLIDGWVYPFDDASPITPPPDVYWRNAGTWWARLVHVPPPPDLLDALAARHPRYSGYSLFADTARTATPAVSPAHHGAA